MDRCDGKLHAGAAGGLLARVEGPAEAGHNYVCAVVQLREVWRQHRSKIREDGAAPEAARPVCGTASAVDPGAGRRPGFLRHARRPFSRERQGDQRKRTDCRLPVGRAGCGDHRHAPDQMEKSLCADYQRLRREW